MTTRREELADDQDRPDDVNPNGGDGASGPGEQGYEEESQVSIVGGQAEIDLEEKADRMAAGDESADPAAGAERVAEPGPQNHP